MKNIQNLQLLDYLDILRRKIWWVIVPGLLASFTSYLFIRTLPDVFESETVILVEPPKIPADYVRPTLMGSIENRLSTITQQIMSRTRLEKIIVQNNLYPEQRKRIPMEVVVEMMRRDIGLTVTKSDAFRITYQAFDPLVAQKVTDEIASLYIEESLKGREEQTLGISDFLQSQLRDTEARLREQESRLSSFRMQHVGELPEQQEALLSTLSRLQQQLQASIDSVNKLDEQRALLERSLSEQKVLSSLRLNPDPQVSTAVTSQKDPLVTELESKKSLRDSLLVRYTPDHPDVRKLDSEIALLGKRVAANVQDKVSISSEVPEPRKITLAESLQGNAKAEIQSRLETTSRQISKGRQEQDSIRSEMVIYQARVDAIPRMEQMQKEITRDYDITKQHYQNLLAKKNDAEMAASLEKRQKGEQFRILDPASFPQKPIRPNRLKLELIGVLAGLALGFSLAVLLELRDETVHTEHEVARLTHLPILATIPPIVTTHQASSGSMGSKSFE